MKVNLDLTAAAAENLISDELKNNVGAAAFNLDHDFFYGDTELEIWTGAGKTGTQLEEDTDYTLAGIDANLTARAGRNVYTTVTIDNVTYQTGDLYFTYQAAADYVDADDRYKVVRASSYWELTSGGVFKVYTTDTGASSVKIDSLGGLDIDTSEGWYIYDDSGAGLYCGAIGDIIINSASGSNITLQALGIGNVEIKTPQTGYIIIESNNTSTSAIDIDSAGGIAINTVLGVNIKDLYGGTGVGYGITLLADNDNASGTGGDVTLQTTATSGTSGNIVVNSAGSIDVDAVAASVITVTNANLTLETVTSGILAINSAGAIDIDGASASSITVTAANLTIDTATSGDIIINSAGAGATAINIQTGSTTRIKIANTGDTVFYGTATVDGALPVITLDQADVDEPFLKVIGDAALTDLTRNLIDEDDVTTPTIVGYLKIEILDDGDQITDGDYFIPFYSLA